MPIARILIAAALLALPTRARADELPLSGAAAIADAVLWAKRCRRPRSHPIFRGTCSRS